MTSDNGFRPSDAAAQSDAIPACRWQESVALHALGSLAAAEVPGLLDHLATGCAPCASERARLEETLAVMDECQAQDVAGAPAPSAGLRAKLMQAVESRAAQPFERPWQRLTRAAAESSRDGLFTVAAGNEGFERTGIEGIEVKPLHVDAARRRVTLLVKMAPGTAYPPHRHATSEECFVVSGELQVGERTLRAGDYQVAAEDSVHGVQSTEKGCVLFIVSSQDDELV